MWRPPAGWNAIGPLGRRLRGAMSWRGVRSAAGGGVLQYPTTSFVPPLKIMPGNISKKDRVTYFSIDNARVIYTKKVEIRKKKMNMRGIR